jgi:hypothetical protein
MPQTYTPIATTTLGSDTAEVTFSSISSAYTDLLIIVSNLTATAANTGFFRVGNSTVDTGTNYSNTLLNGNGTSATSSRGSNSSAGLLLGAATAGLPSSTPSQAIINLQNYSNTTTYKTAITRYGLASGETEANVSLWRSTSAINIITFRINPSGSYKTGTVFTLYGILKA